MSVENKSDTKKRQKEISVTVSGSPFVFNTQNIELDKKGFCFQI